MTDEKHLTKVECFYQTMTRRDPHKRQVKLVKPHLLQLDFAALGESSDDSDFKLDPEDDDGGSGSGKNAASSDNNSSSGSNSSSSDEDGDDDEDDENENEKNDDNEETNEACTNGDKDNIENKSTAKPSVNVKESLPSKVLICSVCLDDCNSQSNEIIECDGCFITVHEGCMGVSDSQSVSSSDSSSSMEPWFCDACKAGVKPHCELCPNRGGLFKETDTGRWVHLVCALYIPGVAFGDVEKLSNITLFEMAYTKWGAKECSLCEDRRFSRSGVCISCDAGMCRTHFHVTCGQKEGLLTEAAAEEEIADPFFAHCRQHVERQRHKSKRLLWSQLHKQLKQATTIRRRSLMQSGTQKGIEKKLNRQQAKHKQTREARKPCWVPEEKVPRLMLSSPYVLKQLFRKAELLGIVPAEARVRRGSSHPGFSAAFIQYYTERNAAIGDLQKSVREIEALSQSLRQQQQCLQVTVEALKREEGKFDGEMEQARRSWSVLLVSLERLHGEKFNLSPALQPPTHFMQRCVKRPYSSVTESSQEREDGEKEEGEGGMKLREKRRQKRENKRFKLDACLTISSEDSNNSINNINNNTNNKNNKKKGNINVISEYSSNSNDKNEGNSNSSWNNDNNNNFENATSITKNSFKKHKRSDKEEEDEDVSDDNDASSSVGGDKKGGFDDKHPSMQDQKYEEDDDDDEEEEEEEEVEELIEISDNDD